MKIIAGIVTFYPNFERLKENIDAIVTQVDHVILVDNGSEDLKKLDALVESYKQVDLIKLFENKGIAFALNRIGKFAVEEKADYFLTLDQDSVVMPGLIEAYQNYIDFPNLGLLNSIHQDRNLSDNDNPITEVVEKELMRTSASLMPTALFEEGFTYDERLFIDKVDFDLNIRLRQEGYKLYEIPYYGLLHELGDIKTHHILGYKVVTYNHSAFRRYYITRNTILLIKKFGLNRNTFVFLIGDIGKEVKTLIFEEDKIKKTKAVFKGWIDGLKFKMN